MKPSCLRPLPALLALAAALAGPAGAATDFPNRPVRIAVGFAPGGTTDLLARIVADQLRVIWNTSVLVENRPGADGIIATTAVHQAPADGTLLLMSTNAIVITPHLKPLPYDPINDFEPITIVGREYHHMMVTPKLPVNSVKEFIDLAKSTSGGLTFSSAGPGQRAVSRHEALHAGCRNPGHGARALSRIKPGGSGSDHRRRTVDVLFALDHLADRPRRQGPPAGGFRSGARSERPGSADAGRVRLARV